MPRAGPPARLPRTRTTRGRRRRVRASRRHPTAGPAPSPRSWGAASQKPAHVVLRRASTLAPISRSRERARRARAPCRRAPATVSRSLVIKAARPSKPARLSRLEPFAGTLRAAPRQCWELRQASSASAFCRAPRKVARQRQRPGRTRRRRASSAHRRMRVVERLKSARLKARRHPTRGHAFTIPTTLRARLGRPTTYTASSTQASTTAVAVAPADVDSRATRRAPAESSPSTAELAASMPTSLRQHPYLECARPRPLTSAR
jgi:hypothetical protein